MEPLPDPALREPLMNLLLAVADDKLILGHRNSDWTGLAPLLEEDIAFSALAQDEIAHAQAIYELAGRLTGRSADQLAFGRTVEEYRCAHIVEVPDEFDWATALVRQFFCDHFDRLRLSRLAQSSWKPLASLAKRLVAEEEIHVQHADGWMIRLGNGTPDSRARIQKALDALTPLAVSLFEPIEEEDALARDGLFPRPDSEGGVFSSWKRAVGEVITRSSLTVRFTDAARAGSGGRRGVHTPHLKELLDEMCEVYRLEPDAAW
jgi:ring-1,2-phenylacetyl-CoA epoxidase subunit PaaC